MTPDLEKRYTTALHDALDAGYQILQRGGSSLDAVEAAVMSLENFPLFNAGKGAVFNSVGKHELDASIMDGKNLAAGAVSAVANVRNPIRLARTIMERSEHVMMSGEGAEIFARLHQIPFEPDEYFFTDIRYQQWLKVRDTDQVQLDHTVQTEKKMGTVGAVALDSNGNLAAATSTGGMTNKKYGRIGDSPIIGAGTYANNRTCAVSCTGHGELFIRSVVAYDVSALMEYAGVSLAEACHRVVMDKLVKIEGEGGLIAIDHAGNICLPFNSEGMYRGYRNASETYIGIYK